MKTIREAATVAVTVLATAWLHGCSSQQVYGAGQAWQRLECNKIIDTQERDRCMKSASTSYDEYKRQAEAAKAAR
jgi:hypothetical protein